MADVFLSYASEDRRLALDVAKRLGEAGFSVWWDRYIHGGADFAVEIELQIKAAKSVIVLWSRVSQSSNWVRDEAAYARDENKLIPLQVDGTPPPLGFRQVQSIDFSGWTGAAESEPFEALIRSLGRMLDPTRASNDNDATPPSARMLPCEASVTTVNGIDYYQCGSNWYTRAYQGDAVVYVPSGPPPSK